MATRIRFILFAVALACVTSGVSAQSIYKQVDDTGHVMFGDQPPARLAVTPRRGGRVEVNEAARRLEQAQLARKLGAQPAPGELSNTPGVRTANYRYWRRQERLRLAVELAQRRSRETLMPKIASQ
jgi:hypothetical protein